MLWFKGPGDLAIFSTKPARSRTRFRATASVLLENTFPRQSHRVQIMAISLQCPSSPRTRLLRPAAATNNRRNCPFRRPRRTRRQNSGCRRQNFPPKFINDNAGTSNSLLDLAPTLVLHQMNPRLRRAHRLPKCSPASTSARAILVAIGRSLHGP